MTSPSATGIPVLVRGSSGSLLVRVPLDHKGKGEFDEGRVQKLVHQAPECLPVGEIAPTYGRLTPICRELNVPTRGSLDNLLMTGEGQIVLVEAKLFRNPEARRQVVAQVLDYATGLFALGYEKFEAEVRRSAGQPEGWRLYDAFPEGERLPEADFHDTVSRNLRRGDVLILVVGDGIRSEAEALLDGLNAYANFAFTLALVELGVFRLPDDPESLIVRPRTLAKTAIVQRTFVDVANTGTVVATKPVVGGEAGSESYWDTLERNVPGGRAALESFVKSVADLQVKGEMLASLNLKWPRPNAKPVNMAYFQKNGVVWTDAAAWFAEGDVTKGYPQLAKAYVEELATVFGCDVQDVSPGKTWTLYKDGKPLRLSAIKDRLSEWRGPMQRYIQELGRRDEAE